MRSHGQIKVVEEILKEMVAVERCFRKMMVDYSAMEDKFSCGKVCVTGLMY